MIEYPSILHYNKAPRSECVAFYKLDGSNIRAKYTSKKGFDLFGSRTQLINESDSFLGNSIPIFKKKYEEKIYQLIKDNFRNERELICYGEYFGPNSFAGYHIDTDEKDFVLFDILVGHKNRVFINPLDFIELCSKYEMDFPQVIYHGNITDQFISDVKENKFNLNEGVICKGKFKSGAYRGHVWMCKIKTNEYLNKLKLKFGEKDADKYGE